MGFRGKTSAVIQLILYLKIIHESFETLDLKHLKALYLDFEKAFDCVPHELELLFQKLQNYGFGGKFLGLIASYLSNRLQYVIVDNENSEKCCVTSGVPQGSILGPLFHTLYVNGLPESLENSDSYTLC